MLGLIVLLLYTSFKSLRLASLIFFAVPVAASGGIAALALRGMPFSIAAGVGFVALFGVAVLNGLVWVAGAEHARQGGLAPREAALVDGRRPHPAGADDGARGQPRLPADGAGHDSGAEIQRPLATVVIGGIITSTLLTAFVDAGDLSLVRAPGPAGPLNRHASPRNSRGVRPFQGPEHPGVSCMRRAIDGMRTRWFGMAAAIRRGLVGAVACVALATTLALGGQPNIVFMLADDQGWNGLSVAMAPGRGPVASESFTRRNLEKLAAAGDAVFERLRPGAGLLAHADQPPDRQEPGRAPLDEGRAAEPGHPLLEPQLVKAIADDEATIGELLRKAGYATAHYGKWHIAGGGPGRHGYDEHDGDTGNEHAYQFTDPNPVDIFGMAERAEAFMEKHARAGRPFFIQLSWNALHAAENALARPRCAKYERPLAARRSTSGRAIAAITEDLDTGVGRVLDAHRPPRTRRRRPT